MIAQIIPIQRLPKQLSVFDYTIPESLEATLTVGQLVTIPLKHSPTQGIVFSIQQKDKEHVATKELIDSIQPVPLISEKHLQLYMTLASWYGMSVATILKQILLPMQKRKLSRMTLQPYSEHTVDVSTPAKTTYSRTANKAAYFSEIDRITHNHTNGQLLILVPDHSRLRELTDHLKKNTQADVVVWHSQLTTKEQFDAWLRIRNGECHIIVGTRSAVWLPFFSLTQVVVTHEADEQYKQAEQQPRFHVQDVLALWQQHYGVALAYMSAIPSFTIYSQGSTNLEPPREETLPRIIDMRSERAQSTFSLLSERTKKELHAVENDVFIFLNRRGYAAALSCQQCGWSKRCERCELPMVYHETQKKLRCHYCHEQAAVSLVCLSCQSPLVRLRGAGTQLVEQYVREELGKQTSHDIIRIDADVDIEQLSLESERPRIIIGTQKALSFIRWERTDLVVLSSLDQQLAIPEYRASESIWQFIHTIMYSIQDHTKFFIQTMNPEHAIFQQLTNPEQFYSSLAKSATLLHYPPQRYLVRYLIGLPSQTKAETVAKQAHSVINTILTKTKKDIMVTSPYDTHPQYMRGKYWYAILVRLSPDTWQEELPLINTCFGQEWRIDPHPFSLLSP